jgi:radical SAM enzyme (TIGR01210 family)
VGSLTIERVTDQIKRATESVGKHYRFDEQHARDQPIELFFQQTHEGTVLFLVFYTLACRYSACTGCNLPATSSLRHVDYRALMGQIDAVFDDARVQQRAHAIRKVIVSNQGSVLDEQTFSSTALMYLVAQVNRHLPQLRTLCLETRPEYIDAAELEFLSRAIREAHSADATIEVAIGFEAYDDEIRNRAFRKGLSLGSFERAAKLLARHGFRLKCYFMQKPVVGMSDEAAIEDVARGIAYFDEIAREYRLAIQMHLNPTYAARGTPLEQAFLDGRYTPPTLPDVARAVLRAKDTVVPVFIGLYDEGLAVDGGSFRRGGDDALVAELERFNATQDFTILESLLP